MRLSGIAQVTSAPPSSGPVAAARASLVADFCKTAAAAVLTDARCTGLMISTRWRTYLDGREIIEEEHPGKVLAHRQVRVLHHITRDNSHSLLVAETAGTQCRQQVIRQQLASLQGMHT